jgi:adenylyltransferase/sulfurtransferase
MPLSEFEAHLNELDPRREIVVMCRSGRRSADVTRYLLQRGFPRVRNLEGGILAWRREIDPTLPEY